MERLTNLQGLYYFYVAANTLSFKKAAQRLFVTPAAISQQIRLLEEQLAVTLFSRQYRSVELTQDGHKLLHHLQQGFEHIELGVKAMQQDKNPHQLAISTLPSFAQHWLVPRIQQFREDNSDLSLLIDPSNDIVNFDNDDIDLSIRYGKGKYDGIEARPLMEEILYPACHPMYQELHQVETIDDLLHADLIEDSWPDVKWDTWLNAEGSSQTLSPISYSGSHFVLEAVLMMQGVGLVKHSLAYRYIEKGALVRIGDMAIRPSFQYYLCAPSHHFQRPKVQRFEAWLGKQIAEYQQHIPDFEKLVGCQHVSELDK